jgi:hypothetical protein
MILIWGVTNKQEETQGMASHLDTLTDLTTHYPNRLITGDLGDPKQLFFKLCSNLNAPGAKASRARVAQ